MAEEDGERPKRRRIHMDIIETGEYSVSEEGVAPLTTPSLVPKSSRDPNRGLYPRDRPLKGRYGVHGGVNQASTNTTTNWQNTDIQQADLNPVAESNGINGDSGDYDSSKQDICERLKLENNLEQKKPGFGFVSAKCLKPENNLEQKKPGFGFVSARSVMDPLSVLMQGGSQSSSSPTKKSPSKRSPAKQQHHDTRWTSSIKNRRGGGSAQSNKLNNYFTSVKSQDDTIAGCSSPPKPSSNTASTVTSSSNSSHGLPSIHNGIIESIDLTQDMDQDFIVPTPSQLHGSQSLTLSHLKQRQQKTPAPRPKKQTTKKKKTPEQHFNRSNSFLYSGPPEQTKRKSSEGSPSTSTDNESKSNNTGAVSDKYGLLGTGKAVFVEEDKDFFRELPLEVIENIFCRLPLMDLCRNLTMVCSRWHDIIKEPMFLQWKKTYFRILRGDERETQRLALFMRDNGIDMANKETVLPGLIRYMKIFKPVTYTFSNMEECLKRHRKYSWAKALIEERLPECVQNESPNPWSIVAALVVLSESVADIQSILTTLLGPHSHCTATRVLECLYCIAAFLLIFKSLCYRDVWTGMHYRVYYALYLFENDLSATCQQLKEAFTHTSGQQTILKYGTGDSSVRYTHEQLRICNHNVGPQEILKIVAFAGTGKTTTLIRYTQLRPQLKFLLVVYNKSVQEHCSARFPINVKCKTSHGLAMSSKVARRYGHKIGNFRVNDIVDGLRPRKGENLFVQAKFVIDTLAAFTASADGEIGLAHAPVESTNDQGVKEYLGVDRRERLVEEAKIVWERAITATDLGIRLPHDGYLKVYQLSRPRLYGYDVILIDEAQDLTPAVIDIVLQQQQPKILVGDPNQQIYSFRGAVNAMDMVTATSTYYLTQSFRFGSEIAFVANCCLELLKGEKKKVLVGNSTKGAVDGGQTGQLAIITRSNFTLFAEAVKKCCYSNEKVKVAFAGGVKGFGFDMLQDIYTLLLPTEDRQKKGCHEITHPLIKKFRSLPDLEKFATKTCDNEMLGKIKIVKSYTHQLPSLISKILARCIRDMDLADIVLSTTHKAKGLEFSTVRVTDDFASNFTPAEARQANGPDGSADEYNLLYVAVTRAKKSLQMSPTLMRVMDYSGEKFRYPRLSSKLDTQGSPLQCLLTDAEFKPEALTLERKTIKMGDGDEIPGGFYSPQIVLEDFPSLVNLYGARTDGRENGRRRTERNNQERRWEPQWMIYRDWDLFMEDEDDDWN